LIQIQVLASSSKGNAYRITDGQTPLLLECGIPFRELQIKLEFKVSEIAGCLASHAHQDHCKSIKDLTKAGIDCFVSRGTADELGVSGNRVKIIEAKKSFKIGTWDALPFDTIHDTPEPLGFLLANQSNERLLYLTDTMYCKYLFNGLSHIMIEANFAKDILDANVLSGVVPVEMKRRLIKSHLSIENVKDLLRANDLSRVQEIHLIHLSDNNSDEARFKREIQQLTGKQVYVASAN
jgi:phosphoribosyl 1,2-cyclic phosphodiesterase